jgi:hypothetical protein
MTFKQFLEAIAAATGKPKRLELPATVAFRFVRRAVRRAIRAIATLADFTATLDRDEVSDLHDDLLEATRRFGLAFALDTS